MTLLSIMDLIATYGLHRWILVSPDLNGVERSFYFTEKELFMDYVDVGGGRPRILLLSETDMSTRYLPVLDVEDKTPKVPICTCDLYSVVLVTGCKCGGK